ncbi:hypothetical protein JR316_0000896 [Psilocybe cubensis]|uniref:Uncharacterized protein n=1 Tax=Psilocybe cubensis TaxID=181762 RepID=A0ACB8HFW7_PSICU|nr:hypothetical protein JR316_0000896 [Psilocybe cubensis]KAH9486831.1 hypothetical protein JR316_0000896 [Psilocybe cubensis]
MPLQWARPSFPLWEDDPTPSDVEPLRPAHGTAPDSNETLKLIETRANAMHVDVDQHKEEVAVELSVEGGEVDVRMRRPPAAKRGIKSKEENVVHSLIRAFLTDKKLIKQDGQGDHRNEDENDPLPSFPTSPDDSAVKSFMAMQTNTGPHRHNPLILWTSPMSHPWNQQVLNHLLDDFPHYAKGKKLLELTQLLKQSIGADTNILEILDATVSPNSVRQILEKKLDARRQGMQAAIRRAHRMQRPTPTSVALTDIELRAQVKKLKIENDRRNRRRERRNIRYIRRFEIIEEQLMLAADDEARDLWRSIQKFYAHFMNEDISSDESEGECRPPLVKGIRRIRRHWISPAVSAVFHFIDKHYTSEYTTGMKKRGAAPLPRDLVSTTVDFLSKPRPELPINFYSSELTAVVLRGLRPKPVFQIPRIPTGVQ